MSAWKKFSSDPQNCLPSFIFSVQEMLLFYSEIYGAMDAEITLHVTKWVTVLKKVRICVEGMSFPNRIIRDLKN